MKYLAIVDDEFLSNFRVDVNPQDYNMILVVEDKAGSTRGIQLKPLPTEALVTKDGKSVYLSQKHIDCLIEMERKEMFDKAVRDMIKRLGLNEENEE